MRRPIISGMAFAFLFVCQASADTTPEQYRSIVDNTIEHYLKPEFSTLKAKTAEALPAIRKLCENPSADSLAAAREGFAGILEAWSRVEYAWLGPLIEDQRLERFSFWPDRKGIGLRQIQQVLANKDETATQVATLRAKSVALQGLQALEFVLFGTGAEGLESGDAFRCAYATAIAENLDNIASEVVAGWNDEDGYSALMRNPGPDNPAYRTPAEPVGDIVEVLTTGFQFIRDIRLGNVVGASPDDSKPRAAAFWRSGLALEAIRANFEGLQHLWEVSGLIPVVQTRLGGSGMIESVNVEFKMVDDAFVEGFPPIKEALADPNEHNRVLNLFIAADTLWKSFAEDISAVLGLRMGFNALDGD
jgi:uncharacterized protein